MPGFFPVSRGHIFGVLMTSSKNLMTSLIYFDKNRIILWSANCLPSIKSKPFANHQRAVKSPA